MKNIKPPKNGSNTNKPINVNNINIMNTQRNRIQSVSNDVFTDSPVNDSVDPTFQMVISKRNHSSTSTGSLTDKNKKNKPIFASPNRFAVLDNVNVDTENTQTTQNETGLDMETEQPKIKPPPPVFIRGILDYSAFRAVLIELIGANNFVVKSSANNLKVQTTNSDTYRSLIKYLKENKAEFHTYQAHEDKSFRIVIRNIHPSTPTTDIGIAIEEIGGFTVRNVTNVLNKTNKNKLPIFFVDLEPAEINKDIFFINSLLNTKIKIEEPYKKRTVIQCINCQEYGHSKSYCAHPPRCVKCASNHPSSTCTKTRDQPPVCALCGGTHTANYRGCQIHKELQRLHYGKTIPKTNTSKPNVSYSQIVNETRDSPEKTQRDIPNINDTSSFPNLTQNPSNSQHKTYKNTPPNNTSNESEIALQLSSFITEFKLILNPLISLLTTVINKLMKDGH